LVIRALCRLNTSPTSDLTQQQFCQRPEPVVQAVTNTLVAIAAESDDPRRAVHRLLPFVQEKMSWSFVSVAICRPRRTCKEWRHWHPLKREKSNFDIRESCELNKAYIANNNNESNIYSGRSQLKLE
jgi:hypothetical protein